MFWISDIIVTMMRYTDIYRYPLADVLTIEVVFILFHWGPETAQIALQTTLSGLSRTAKSRMQQCNFIFCSLLLLLLTFDY